MTRDIGNGLYHYGARYYQPSIARWTQMDPLLQPGDLGQANRYLYVGNNPINETDPSGLCFPVKCSTVRAAGRTARGVYELAKDAVRPKLYNYDGGDTDTNCKGLAVGGALGSVAPTPASKAGAAVAKTVSAGGAWFSLSCAF